MTPKVSDEISAATVGYSVSETDQLVGPRKSASGLMAAAAFAFLGLRRIRIRRSRPAISRRHEPKSESNLSMLQASVLIGADEFAVRGTCC